MANRVTAELGPELHHVPVSADGPARIYQRARHSVPKVRSSSSLIGSIDSSNVELPPHSTNPDPSKAAISFTPFVENLIVRRDGNSSSHDSGLIRVHDLGVPRVDQTKLEYSLFLFYF